MKDPVDLARLKAHPRFVEYLTEGQCNHLELYRSYARDILVLYKFIDDKNNKRRVTDTLADNKTLRENQTAEIIKATMDRDLIAIIEVQNLGSDPDPICHLFARLVIDYEDDKDCQRILEDLRTAGISIEKGTCI